MHRVARGFLHFMVRGLAGRVKPAGTGFSTVARAEVTLLFRDLRLAHIRQKPGIRRTAPGIRRACLGETEVPIHSQANLIGVRIFLAIVFPPANRTQLHRRRRFQRPVAATRAAKTHLGTLLARRQSHIKLDALFRSRDDIVSERYIQAAASILYHGDLK